MADLAIELEFNSVDGVVVEPQGKFIARITNFGPDIAAVDATLERPITLSSGVVQDNGSFTPDIQFAPSAQNNNQECFFILVIGEPPPGGMVSYIYTIRTPPIEINETIECFGIFSTHFDSGTREVNWKIRNTFDDDPVSANDTQTVVFGIAPKIVPINHLSAMIALLFMFLFIGVYAVRRNNTKV